MVTFVPPAAGPEAGDTLLRVRDADVVPNVNPPGSAALVLSGLVTATLTDPEACGGVVAFSWFALTKETPAAALPPKETVAPLAKFDPVIVTTVPPAVPPELGVTLLTARDDGVPNVKAPGSMALVLSGLVTATLTEPVACAGVTALSCVELTNETDAGLPPKETVAPLTKLEPVMVTAVPPAVAPDFGVTLLTAGDEAV